MRILELLVYPNPAKDYVILESELFINTETEIAMFDMYGQKVFAQKVKPDAPAAIQGKGRITLDVSLLSKGLYLLTVGEYVRRVVALAFGLLFQLPVVLSLLGRIGVVSAPVLLRKGRRYAIVGIAAFSALVTPNDVISMFVMALPVYALYEISIWIVAAMEQMRIKEEAASAVTPPAP